MSLGKLLTSFPELHVFVSHISSFVRFQCEITLFICLCNVIVYVLNSVRNEEEMKEYYREIDPIVFTVFAPSVCLFIICLCDMIVRIFLNAGRETKHYYLTGVGGRSVCVLLGRGGGER